MSLHFSTFMINPNFSTLWFSLSLTLSWIYICKLFLHVSLCLKSWDFVFMTDAPKTPSVTVSPSGGIEEGSSVTLSCSSDANPAANYTWFKEHEDSVRESGKHYTITNITSEHGGNYYCQAHNAIGLHNSTFLLIKGNWSFWKQPLPFTLTDDQVELWCPIVLWAW